MLQLDYLTTTKEETYMCEEKVSNERLLTIIIALLSVAIILLIAKPNKIINLGNNNEHTHIE